MKAQTFIAGTHANQFDEIFTGVYHIHEAVKET